MEEESVWNRWKEVAAKGMRGGGAGIVIGKKKQRDGARPETNRKTKSHPTV